MLRHAVSRDFLQLLLPADIHQQQPDKSVACETYWHQVVSSCTLLPPPPSPLPPTPPQNPPTLRTGMQFPAMPQLLCPSNR